jgi:hypothetical protein
MVLFCIAVIHVLTQQPPSQGLGIDSWIYLIFLYAFLLYYFSSLVVEGVMETK